MVRAEEFALEDVVTHVLRNADRHRAPGSRITLSLATTEPGVATVAIHNQGPRIAGGMIGRIFEYGVSGAQEESGAEAGRRGQGLFVARTYMGKMGGGIEARNEDVGVTIVLRLPSVL
jgi:K+-sensing histidine kinase KdpD